MTNIKKVPDNHPDFRKLVAQLDAYLAVTDGEEHDFYHQYNGLESLDCAVVFYENEEPVGCGAFKNFAADTVEVKRMFVEPSARRKGIAAKILTALEEEARNYSMQFCVLETGKRQIEAVPFYQKCGYKIIENYGQYVGMENSVCFRKGL